MKIERRLNKALQDYQNNEIDNALIQVVIALDATAKAEKIEGGNGERCKKFIAKNIDIITRTSLGLLEIRGGMSFNYTDNKGNKKTKSLEEVLYHLIRCNLLHEADLPDEVEFTKSNSIGLNNGKILLPQTIVFGLIMSIVGSEANSNKKFTEEFIFSLDGQNFSFNDFWGKKEKILKVFRDNAKKTGI